MEMVLDHNHVLCKASVLFGVFAQAMVMAEPLNMIMSCASPLFYLEHLRKTW